MIHFHELIFYTGVYDFPNEIMSCVKTLTILIDFFVSETTQ